MTTRDYIERIGLEIGTPVRFHCGRAIFVGFYEGVERSDGHDNFCYSGHTFGDGERPHMIHRKPLDDIKYLMPLAARRNGHAA